MNERVRKTDTVAIEVIEKEGDEVVAVDSDVTHYPVETLRNPAQVSVGGSVTKNLGDFNSVKVSVVITRNCRDTDEEVDKMYLRTSNMVDRYINEELDAVLPKPPPKRKR